MKKQNFIINFIWQGYGFEKVQDIIKQDLDTEQIQEQIQKILNDPQRQANIQILNQKLIKYMNYLESLCIPKQFKKIGWKLNLFMDRVLMFNQFQYDFGAKNLLEQDQKDIGEVRKLIRTQDILLSQSNQQQQYDSLLLMHDDFKPLINQIDFHVRNLKLLYRGTRDGMNAYQFHTKCDNKGPTLIVIQSQNYKKIFGGYSTCKWSGGIGNWIPDPERKGFLFSVTEKSIHKIKEEKKQFAYMCNSHYGPIFGDGRDMILYKDFEQASIGNQESNIGSTYQIDKFEPYSTQARLYLAGEQNFKVKEIEVFEVEF